MKGTSAAASAMAALQGIQFVNTQIAIANASIQAKAAFATGNILGGALLTASAIMMEANAIQILEQQRETRRTQNILDEFRRQADSWR
jgi:murein endopeptidase